MNKEQFKQKYIEFQLLEQQIEQVQQQLIAISQQALELKRLNENLDEIKKIKPNTKILTQLGPGIFLNSELKDNKKIFMHTGANTVVQKTLEEAKEIVRKQLDQIDQITKQMGEGFEKLALHREVLQRELTALAEQEKKA